MASASERLGEHRGARASSDAPSPSHRALPVGHPPHGAETLVGMPWLLRLRWGAVAGQCIALAAARILLAANLPWALMGVLVALTAASNVGLSMISSRARGERLIPMVLVVDALVLTAMLVASGGPANPFSVFFLVHVALASLLLPPRAAWGLVGLTVLAFGSLFLWPGQDHHAHVHPVGATHLVGMWVSYALTASFVAYFIGKVSQALRDRDRDLAAVERLALQNERLATLSSFSANAAHELATPLATIGLAAKDLAAGVAAADPSRTPRLQADADLICREIARCRTILADIAARAGESMGEMPTRTTPRDIVRALPRDTTPRLVVRFDGADAADAPVVVPRETLAQMVANLVRNAFEAHERAAVGESIRAHGGRRRPPRLSRSRSGPGSLAVGRGAPRGAVRHHQGARRRPGARRLPGPVLRRASRRTPRLFRAPRRRPRRGARAAGRRDWRSVVTASAHTSDVERKTVLVVDDEDTFRTRLMQALEERGFEVWGAATAEQATSAAERETPEYAVVDLRLPGTSGLQIVRRLHDLDPTTRIVVLTGYGSIATALDAVRSGAAHYLTKPADIDEILAGFEQEAAPSIAPPPAQIPTLARVEWEHIERVMVECGGNVTQAARLLGLHRRSLQRKLAKPPGPR